MGNNERGNVSREGEVSEVVLKEHLRIQATQRTIADIADSVIWANAKRTKDEADNVQQIVGLLYGLHETNGLTDAQLGMVCTRILLDLAVHDMLAEMESDAA
jgi:hypothetical protein